MAGKGHYVRAPTKIVQFCTKFQFHSIWATLDKEYCFIGTVVVILTGLTGLK